MQVNLSATLPNPAGETSAKCPEAAGAGADTGFLAQMDQILNQSEENSDLQQEESSPVTNQTSNRQMAAKSLLDAVLNSPQVFDVKKTPDQNLSSTFSESAQLSKAGNPDALLAQAPPQATGKSGGMTPSIRIETGPAQISELEKEDAETVPPVQIAADSTAAVNSPQSVTTLDLSAHIEELLRPQKAPGNTPSMVDEGRSAGTTGTIPSAGMFKDANTSGMYSETHIPVPMTPESDSSQNLSGADLQNYNAGQPRWNVELQASASSDDSSSYAGFLGQSGNSQNAVQGKLQDGSRSFSGRASAHDEGAPSTTQQDVPISAQLNLDFLNAQISGGSRELSDQTQWTNATEELRLAGSANRPQIVGSQNAVSAAAFLKNLPKAVPASIMNSDTVGAGADTMSASNKTALPIGQHDGVQSTQLNLDFLAAGKAGTSLQVAAQSQQTDGIRERNFSEDAAATQNIESKSILSAVNFSKSPPKTAAASTMTIDTASVSVDQKQADYPTGSWLAAQGKPEPAQSNQIRQDSSAADRYSPTPPVFASGSAANNEAVAAPSDASVQSTASHASEIILQLAEQIRIQVRDGKGEIRIQLKPDSLGRLEISAENTIQGLSARISTESNAVKSYLESNLQSLQQTLQDQGLKIDRIHIVVQDAFDAQSSSGFSAQYGHAGPGQDGRDPQFSKGVMDSAPASSLDEAVIDTSSWLALNPNNRFYIVA
jgi:flagellar hook-length control protein FliK